MFKSKKIEKQIQKLEAIKQEIEFIQNQLKETSPKIDITDVYVFEKDGVYSLAKLHVENIDGLWLNKFHVDAYLSTLTNIFTNEIIFEKCARSHIDKKELVIERDQKKQYKKQYWVNIFPIYEIEHNLLAYTDKKVPLYVLQRLYYKLNNIDLNCPILKKQK